VHQLPELPKPSASDPQLRFKPMPQLSPETLAAAGQFAAIYLELRPLLRPARLSR